MTTSRLAVLACGVLEWNIRRVAARLPGLTLLTRILPAQLHNSPRRLRGLLQQEIDALDAAGEEVDGICIGYGVCGRGTVGLLSRRHPLVIPRVQDCIGVFLGSHGRYLGEFSQRPGTRYMTEGWYDKTVRSTPTESYFDQRDRSLYQTSFEELAAKHGEENAAYICAFRESWRRNYQRAAYIRFPGEEAAPPGQAITEGMAASLGWEHTVLEGDESLLYAMLSGEWHDPRLLLVPPRSKTVTAPGAAILGFSAGYESQADEILARYQARHAAPPIVRQGIGLGIDTGGTYTDGVLYDFSSNRILAYAKAPTVHEDLVQGIEGVLRELPADILRRVERVGISTTLATNATVERKGRPVALLVMSPFAIHTETLPFRFVRKIAGAMSMEGEETAPLDPEQIRGVAREAKHAGCEAVAISGFGSVINPTHEQEAARIVLEAAGLHAVCGHELTTHLNFMERATTAAMNARLVPLIENLLDAVTRALAEAGPTAARVMVVRGDGSQMLDRVARDLPVETLLSGPAASVIGAARLLKARDAIVADMGGTTLDLAVLHDGLPVLADAGARIGEFQTSVRAMAVRTIGLGGDSEIDLAGWPRVRIGPRRVIPICRLPARFPKALARLDAVFRRPITVQPNILDFVCVSPGTACPPGNRLLETVAGTPQFLIEVCERLNRPAPAYVPWQDEEAEGRLQRFGLTLTDILHAQGSFTAFDRDAAASLLGRWAALLDVDAEAIIEAVHREFRRMVIDELIALTVPADCPWEHSEDGVREWLTAHLADERGGRGRLRLSLGIDYPLLPVGAPVAVMFPQLQSVMKQPVQISEYAGVANAFGAIAGDVVLQETAVVRVTESGGFLCSWRGGVRQASSLTSALEICDAELRERMRESAAANDIPYAEPVFTAAAQEASMRDGKLFLGVTLKAELRG
ncbi:MAG: Acetophenone carboxylase gamma subunit [candidate division BRC1 bacterium ADurb.BinA292]|nr:MAG: Acetophenone carboxylase gamma subunit [candidate division BRC1 bacterium ADurb.BinA292]